jgi:hypothetical protein
LQPAEGRNVDEYGHDRRIAVIQGRDRSIQPATPDKGDSNVRTRRERDRRPERHIRRKNDRQQYRDPCEAGG